MTRVIKRIFVHCTATSQDTSVESIQKGWKRLQWKSPGYHYIIKADGAIVTLQGEDKSANGVKGYNATSIHLAYIGGVDIQGSAVDNRTDAQKKSIRHLLRQLRMRYPKAVILGHRDISPDRNGNGRVDRWERIKECPCFDAMTEYRDI